MVFAVALVVSMGGLAYAMRELPLGTAYAVWVGIGAVLTVAYAMATGAESVSAAKLLLLTSAAGCWSLPIPPTIRPRSPCPRGRGPHLWVSGLQHAPQRAVR